MCKGAQQELGMVLHLMLTLRTPLPYCLSHGHTAQAAVQAGTEITSIQASLTAERAPRQACTMMQHMIALAS